MSDKNPKSNNSIPENTPEWLRRLLFKYGESEGILSGAHKRPDSLPEPTEAFSNATTDISGMIASIDETLPADHEELSVPLNWDDELAESSGVSPAMDDLLNSLREAGADVDDLTAEPESESIPDNTEEVSVFPAMGDTDWLFSGEGKTTDISAITEETEVPDWLTEFSEMDAAMSTPPPPTSADDETTLEDEAMNEALFEDDEAGFDWLNELSADETVPDESESVSAVIVENPSSNEEDFSWMDDLTPTADASTENSSAVVQPSTDDIDEAWDADWLKTVAQQYPVDPVVAEKTDIPMPSDDPELTLTEIESLDDTSLVTDLPQIDAAQPFGAQSESDDMPLTEVDTLADAAWTPDLPQVDATEPEAMDLIEVEPLNDAVPDWLSNLRDTADADTNADADTEPEADKSEAAEDTALFDEMPDWLTESQILEDGESETEPSVTSDDLSASDRPTLTDELRASTVPDWLSNLRDTNVNAEIESEAESESDAGEKAEDDIALFDEMPNWLLEAQNIDVSESDETEALFASDEVPPVPEQPVLADESDAEETPIEPPTVPDWLSNLRDTADADTDADAEIESDIQVNEIEATEDIAALFEDVPDWLVEEISKEDIEPEPEPESDDAVPQIPEQPALADEPWLLSGDSQESVESKAIDLSTLNLDDIEDTSDETASSEMLSDDDTVGTADTPFEESDSFSMDVPDWMKNLDLDEPDDFSFDDLGADVSDEMSLSDDAETTSSPNEIEPDDTSNEIDETDTLLSDLQSLSDAADETEAVATVVPADMEVDVPDDEPLPDILTLPDGVQPVDDKAVAMDEARDFYGIVQPSPDMPQTPEKSKPLSTLAKIIRALLGIVFIILIGIPLFSHYDRGGYPFPWLEPSSDMQELIQLELQNVVGKQTPHNVALVAFDFTPATEGEMNPLATIVLKKLLGQGMRVIAVSLEPEGTGMIETIFDAVRTDTTADSLLNAGYLPGGAIAIRALSAESAFANLRDVQQNKHLSQMDDWADVRDFNDVDLLVEISANPDTARWWVEQNTMADMPRLAVVSAVAEPFVRPYRRSLQYDALIAGINGAAALESSRRQQTLSPASAMLDSQSVAHILVMILMLGGTIAGWIATYGQESD